MAKYQRYGMHVILAPMSAYNIYGFIGWILSAIQTPKCFPDKTYLSRFGMMISVWMIIAVVYFSLTIFAIYR
jgi:hypothetical protein